MNNFLQKINPFKKNKENNINKSLSVGNVSYGHFDNLFNRGTDIDSKLSNLETSWANSAIRIRSENVASCDILLYKKNRNGEEEEIKQHEFLDVINKTNIYQLSFSDILKLISTGLDITGASYLLIIKNSKNKPYEILPLPMGCVTPETDRNNSFITGYRFGNKVYKSDEIICFRLPCPKNPLLKNKPTISGLERIIRVDNAIQVFQEIYFKNFTNTNLSISTDANLSEGEYNRVIELIRNQYSGLENSGGRPLFLTNNMKLESAGNNSNTELSYTNSQNSIRKRILGHLGVPDSLVGYSENSNRSVSDTQLSFFLQNTILPFSKNISKPLNYMVKYFYGDEYSIKFDYPQILTENDMKLIQMMVQSSSISGNELRELEGYGNEDVYSAPVKLSGIIEPDKEKDRNDAENN